MSVNENNVQLIDFFLNSPCLIKNLRTSTMQTNHNQNLKSEKSYVTAVVISGVFGIMGIHHFYVERWAMGILDLGLFILMITLFIMQEPLFAYLVLLIDLVHTVIVTYWLLTGQYRDGYGKIIAYPGQKIENNQ